MLWFYFRQWCLQSSQNLVDLHGWVKSYNRLFLLFVLRVQRQQLLFPVKHIGIWEEINWKTFHLDCRKREDSTWENFSTSWRWHAHYWYVWKGFFTHFVTKMESNPNQLFNVQSSESVIYSSHLEKVVWFIFKATSGRSQT